MLWLSILVIGSASCTSSKSLAKPILVIAPIEFDKPYFQAWIAGVQGGGSGINLFLPTKETYIELDSVYFRGMVSKLKIYESGYVARFKTNLNQGRDLIMSAEEYAEYANTLPDKKTAQWFDIDDNTCVLSYKDEGTIKYFLINNLEEHPTIPYPSAAPKP